MLEGKEVGIGHCHDKDFGRGGRVRLLRYHHSVTGQESPQVRSAGEYVKIYPYHR